MREFLNKWNAFRNSHSVDVSLSDEELHFINLQVIEKYLEKRKVNNFDESGAAPIINMRPCRLYRLFNDGSFAHGGRFYGGCWQSFPSRYRQYVTINGLPTVELDFRATQAAMLYAMEGVQLEGDAYAIDGIGVEHRKQIKTTLLTLVNASADTRVWGPPKGELPEGWTGEAFVTAITDKHDRIAHWFRSGIGIKLQRIESDIAEVVMGTLMSENNLALPIHDSFIVQREHRDRLEQVMKEAYRKMMWGFEIEVKEA